MPPFSRLTPRLDVCTVPSLTPPDQGEGEAKSVRKPLPLREANVSRSNKAQRMGELISLVQGCRACPRMEGRRRVLSNLNGNPNSKILFIAEAPGRNGADRTGIPIHGDPTGNNFERLLATVGLRREEVFITNAVLCNPRKEDGTNDTPNEGEARRCSFHLQSTIAVLDPLVVVTLGQRALESLSLISPHRYMLRSVVATLQEWDGRVLFPLYHPSPRVLVHRSLKQQAMDFWALSKLVTSLDQGE